MKRYLQYLVALLLLSGAFSANAQVHLYIDSVSGNVGDQLLVPVRVNNFTNLISAQGSIHWDESVATYSGIDNYGLPGMGLGNFGTSNASNGELAFAWFDFDLSGETFADSTILFEIRFTLSGNTGDSTSLDLLSTPTSIEFINSSFATAAFTTSNGHLEISGQPGTNAVTLIIDSATAVQNDVIAIPVRVANFSGIAGTQGSITWNPNVGSFIQVQQFGVSGMGSGNFGTSQASNGQLTFVWTDPNFSGVTLADSTVLFEMQFSIVGQPGSSTNIGFANSPTQVEVVDSNLNVINPLLNGGLLEVEPDSTGLFTLLIDSVLGIPTQSVLVPVRAKKFTDILSMQGSFAFDTSVVSYSGVTSFSVPGMTSANFGIAQAAGGAISFSWFDTDLSGETIADSTVLFALQFDVVGETGEFGFVRLSDSPTFSEFIQVGLTTIAFDLDSGGVEVDTLDSFILIDPLTQLTWCANDSITVDFESHGTWNTGNVYTLQLSDTSGNFGSPVAIGTLSSTADSGQITGFLPSATLASNAYRLRIVASDSAITGDDNGIDIAILSYNDSVTAIICEGDSILLGGSYQSTAGSYIDTLTSATGCDSLVVTTLSLDTVVLTNTATAICAGDSVLLGGSYQTAAGTFTDSLTAASGCDSLVITVLTIDSVYLVPDTMTICPGDSALLGGMQQLNPGTYYDTLQTAAGCDSVLQTTLFWHGIDTVYAADSICAGDSIFLAAAWHDTAGVFTDVLVDATTGCDSILITTLSILPVPQTALSDTICENDSLLVGGAYQDTAGVYLDTLTAANGCDSIVTTTLVIMPTYAFTDTTAICDGDSALLAGQWHLVAGTYIDTFSTGFGCDSLWFHVLQVNPVFHDSINVGVCAGDSLFLEGAWRDTTGVFVDSLSSGAGCDSVITTFLTVDSLIQDSTTATICPTDSLLLGGAWQSAAGFYVDTLLANGGCDSIVTTQLIIQSTIRDTVPDILCESDSTFVGNGWQTVPGFYSDTLVANGGCDSVVVTNLALVLRDSTTVLDSLCAGDSLLLGNVWRFTSGLYYDTLSNASGCDSILSTQLTIIGPLTGLDSLTICFGDSALIGNAWRDTSGTFVDTLVGFWGCDSLVSITLTVLPAITSIDSVAVCPGDSVFLAGSWQLAPGPYVDSLVAADGCDSLITTTLQWITYPLAFDTLAVCPGDSLFIGNAWHDTLGTFNDTLTSAQGCDSVRAITMQHITYPLAFDILTVCPGDSLFIGNAWHDTLGTFNDTLTSAEGCDSVRAITVQYITYPPAFDTVAICLGDSIVLGGTWQSVTGTYNDTLTSTEGCDSVVAVTLYLIDYPLYLNTITICPGDSALIGGLWQTAAGTYDDTLISVQGCDSITAVTLNLITYPIATDSTTLCPGDSVLIGNTWAMIPGVYNDTLTSAQGCDSITAVTLSYTTYPLAMDTLTLCDGDSVFVGGDWQTMLGIYIDTLSSAQGCDSIVQTEILAAGLQPIVDSAFVCFGDSAFLGGAWQTAAGTYIDTIVAPSGCDTLKFTLLSQYPTSFTADTLIICEGDSAFLAGSWQFAAGVFTDTLATNFGCDSIISTELLVGTIDTTIVPETICNGDSIQINGLWETTPGTYYVPLLNALGCDSTVQVELDVTVVDVSVTVNGSLLFANLGSTATYQWFDCSTNQEMPGEVFNAFVSQEGGTFAAHVAYQGCVDSTDCYTVVSVNELVQTIPGVEVYPNPFREYFTVAFGQPEAASLVLFDAAGREVYAAVEPAQSTLAVSVGNLPAGMYLLRIQTSDRTGFYKLFH